MADLRSTARALAVSPATLRRWLAEGAPQARRGRRGRGGGAELDPQAIAAWRACREAPEASGDAALRALAGELPELLADAAWSAFAAVEGPAKRHAAGTLAGAWYVSTTALLDRIRREGLDVADPTALPAHIERLRKIAQAMSN